MSLYAERLKQVSQVLKSKSLGGFLLPMNDEYFGEYVPPSAQRLGWLTGFTGSAGTVAVLHDKAAFFTDGRYTLQAEQEVDATFERHNSGDLAPEVWIAKEARDGDAIGYDPFLFSYNQIKRFEKAGAQKNLRWVPVLPDPIDELWKDRPTAPASPVAMHPSKYTGKSSEEKRRELAKQMKADACVLTLSDSICWLLNVRGMDVPHTPFILSYAILHADGAVQWFIDPSRVPEKIEKVEILPPSALAAALAKLKGKKILYDPASSPVWFYDTLKEAGCEVIQEPDPCQLPKACKNPVELAGIRAAHLRDGLALTRAIHEISTRAASMNELTVMETVLRFRKESKEFRDTSFTTIAGSGPNGAVVHYRATEKTSRKIDNNNLLLIDSGGQYPDGTTDVTRTIVIGNPSTEMKDRFTCVLKGHIALARAIFPEGTTGQQLDSLARYALWQEGLDYDHGTGHGVGAYLSVHEGPQRISKKGSDVALQAGMILSNEPGYYKAGEYGIRIENLVAVVEKSVDANGKKWFGFETLTLVPIDTRAIDWTMLSPEEKVWLDEYHARIRKSFSGALNKAEEAWLNKATHG